MCVKVIWAELANTLPAELLVTYLGEEHVLELYVGQFTRSIRDRRPIHCDRFNILVFGVGGTGKSSLICKFATLLGNGLRPNLSFAPVGGGQRHITTSLVRYALPGTMINVWDTWGFHPSNYRDSTLAHIFEGNLPSNWQMGEMLGSDLVRLAGGAETKHQRRIHAAILVVDHEALASPEYRDAMKDMFVHFTSFTPLVVVNKVDEYSSGWRQPDSHLKWAKFKKTVADACLVNPNSVFLNVNYVVETDCDAILDKQALMILDEAVARAVRFEAQHGNPAAVLPHGLRTCVFNEAAYEW